MKEYYQIYQVMQFKVAMWIDVMRIILDRHKGMFGIRYFLQMASILGQSYLLDRLEVAFCVQWRSSRASLSGSKVIINRHHKVVSSRVLTSVLLKHWM